MLADIPLLPVDERLVEVTEAYVKALLMPRDPTGDALHLAYASLYSCQFLRTWNCRHLANPRKAEPIRRVNDLLGLPSPCIVTPLELTQSSLL